MPKKLVWQLHHLTYEPERVVVCTRPEHWHITKLNRFSSLSKGCKEAIQYILDTKPIREKE